MTIELTEILEKLIILIYNYPVAQEYNDYRYYDDIQTFDFTLKHFLSPFKNNFMENIDNLLYSCDNIDDFINLINNKRDKIYIINIFNSIPGYDESTNIIDCIEYEKCSDYGGFFKPFFTTNKDFLIPKIIINNTSFYIYQPYNENTIKYECYDNESKNIEDKVHYNFKIKKIFLMDMK